MSCGVNHRTDVAADNQRPTHAPLCEDMCACVLVCVSVQNSCASEAEGEEK